MSEHPMKLSAISRRRVLEQLSDDDLRSTMMEASTIIRDRERFRRNEFRQAMRRLWPEFPDSPAKGSQL